MIRAALPRLPAQSDVLILGNGPSLRGRSWGDVPRDRTFVLGINQSWRETQDVDAHLAMDIDQYLFEDPQASGFGGRSYYESLDARGRVYHTRAWANHGVQLDRHDALVFSRRPFQWRHRGAHVPKPEIDHDGGVALHAGDDGSTPGSICYAALQLAAASGFERFWFVGLDMNTVKFEGAIGWAEKRKRISTSTGAWSNSDRHDSLWKRVPADVKDRVRVIAPSATKVLQVVDWPWPGPRAGNA